MFKAISSKVSSTDKANFPQENVATEVWYRI